MGHAPRELHWCCCGTLCPQDALGYARKDICLFMYEMGQMLPLWGALLLGGSLVATKSRPSFLPLARAAWRSCALLNLPSPGSSLYLSLWPPLTCDRPILPDCSVTFLTSPSFPTSWPSPAPGGTETLARAMGPGPAQGTAMEASCRPCPAWRRSRRLR